MKTALRVWRRKRSSTLEAAQEREIGRNDLETSFGLPGFKIGITMACFKFAGISALCNESLPVLVR